MHCCCCFPIPVLPRCRWALNIGRVHHAARVTWILAASRAGVSITLALSKSSSDVRVLWNTVRFSFSQNLMNYSRTKRKGFDGSKKWSGFAEIHPPPQSALLERLHETRPIYWNGFWELYKSWNKLLNPKFLVWNIFRSSLETKQQCRLDMREWFFQTSLVDVSPFFIGLMDKELRPL
jgi:hypothetical protein